MAKIVLIVLMCVVFESNGHLLKNILSDVHDRVHGIAGSVLGGLNIHGHVNGHLHHHNPPPPPPEQETVIVVVEDGDNGGNYGPGPGQNPHGNYNNQNGPHHMRPGYGHHGQWQGNNEGNQHHHNPHHHDHHGNNNPGYDNPGYNPGYNNHGNNNPGYNHHGNENPGYNNQGHNNPGYNNPEYNNQGNNNPGYNNGGQNNYNQQPNTPGYQNNNQNNYTPNPNQENKPTYGTIHSEPTQSPPKFGTTTKEEEPLYVPLKPNEYNYGGEKIDINPPKRETGTDSESESPADENIDIRLGNK